MRNTRRDIVSIKDYVKKYKAGQNIYPGTLSKKFGREILSVYQELEEYAQQGMIKQVIQLSCPYCKRMNKAKYYSLFDIPENSECEYCGKEIKDSLNHALVLYERLDN